MLENLRILPTVFRSKSSEVIERYRSDTVRSVNLALHFPRLDATQDNFPFIHSNFLIPLFCVNCKPPKCQCILQIPRLAVRKSSYLLPQYMSSPSFE